MDDAEFEERLQKGNIAYAHLRDISSVLDHPQLVARNRWVDVASPGGLVRSSVPPIDIEGVSPRMEAIPSLGEHTESVRSEFGDNADSLDGK